MSDLCTLCGNNDARTLTTAGCDQCNPAIRIHYPAAEIATLRARVAALEANRDKALDRVAELNGERDLARDQLQRQFDQTVRFRNYLVEQRQRAETAEAQVAELSASLKETAAVLQALVGARRLVEAEQFRLDLDDWRFRTIGETLDAANKALGPPRSIVDDAGNTGWMIP